MKDERILKKGDAVFLNCENPATGHIKRLGKLWADVEWNVGVGCIYTERVKVKHLILLLPVLNKITKKYNTCNKCLSILHAEVCDNDNI